MENTVLYVIDRNTELNESRNLWAFVLGRKSETTLFTGPLRLNGPKVALKSQIVLVYNTFFL